MPAHPLSRPARNRFFWPMGIALSCALLATGCAQQREEGYYAQPGASSLSDAQYESNGAGYREVARAPSQLQIALKPGQPSRQQQAQQQAQQQQAQQQAQGDGQPQAANQSLSEPPAANAGDQARIRTAPSAQTAQGVRPELAKLIPQAQTFLGTLPCLSSGMQCTAARYTLTLSPNGRWRARQTYLEASQNNGKPNAEQGCWDTTGERPPHVLLLDNQGNARAEFLMSANNVLEVRSVAGVRPNLSYRLTRQPDLDPIDELGGQAGGACQ